MTDPLSLTLLKGQNADAPPEDPGVDTPIDQVEDILTALYRTHVKAFELHRYPVTNAMYELFDPSHKSNRWKSRLHTLAQHEAGDDDSN